MMKKLLVAACLSAFASVASAQVPSVMGVWMVEKKTAQVRIAPCPSPANGPICGTIVHILDLRGPNGQVTTEDAANDWRNVDPKLRDRKVLGLVILYNFKKTSDPNSFEDGYIYNGDNGKTYNANVSLLPDGSLKVRGYVGSPMFGESQVWTRVGQ